MFVFLSTDALIDRSLNPEAPPEEERFRATPNLRRRSVWRLTMSSVITLQTLASKARLPPGCTSSGLPTVAAFSSHTPQAPPLA